MMWAIVSALMMGAYIILYFYRTSVLDAATLECRPIGPEWLRNCAVSWATMIANSLGVRIASVGGEGMDADKARRYMYVWHPHGFAAYVPSWLMGGMATSGAPHDRVWYGTCTPILFKVPGVGDQFALTNARPVDKRSLEAILGHKNGSTIALQPGGMKEQAATRHDQEQAFFPKRLGFIRLAIKYQTPLMPMYLFGESQLYRRVDGLDWLTKAYYNATGLTFPIITAKFGLPMCFPLPRATDIHVRYGNPVEVGPQADEPSDERVNEIFERYLVELQRIFDANASACLPPEVAAKGLKVVRL